MNIVIPAEATLDVYKCAYALMRFHNLRLCNITVAYANKSFHVNDKDYIIGMYIALDSQHTGTVLHSFESTLAHMGNPSNFTFLMHIPNSVLMCFRDSDKTVLMTQLFAAFDAFDKNTMDMTQLPQKIAAGTELVCGSYRIMVCPSDSYMHVEERSALFKSGFQYIVFSSGNSVGVQRSLRASCPMLDEFARAAKLPSSTWFAPRKGHLLISKSGCTPDLTVDELAGKLVSYLSQKL